MIRECNQRHVAGIKEEKKANEIFRFVFALQMRVLAVLNFSNDRNENIKGLKFFVAPLSQ